MRARASLIAPNHALYSFLGILAYFLGYEVQMNRNFPYIRDDSISWQTKIAEHGYSADELLHTFEAINKKR